VTSGKRYWSDGTNVAGQQFEYSFDDIGNRLTASSGGDQGGANLRSQNYSANNLNQYTQRTVPPYVDVQGSAHSNATVTVNTQSTYRKAEYFRAELSADNSGGPLWFGVTNVAVLTNGSGPDIVTTNEGNLLVAKATETFLHDLDGNLTSDSLWTNTWNGENRLIATESRTDVPSAGRAKETWTHLPDGRWIERVVANWNGSAYTNAYTNRFMWDAQVLLAILDHTNGLISSFIRGLDLSGSIQGAGGVGGVLAVNIATNGVHFAAFDGNGNMSALVSATTGDVTASYEYSPFGETLRVNGVVAKANPIRFSTQFADDVTGRKKYLHRELTDTGRWLNRDPIEEIGGVNLYGFVHNSPIGRFDRKGLSFLWDTLLGCVKSVGEKALEKYLDKVFACGALTRRLRDGEPSPGEAEYCDIDLCKGFDFKPKIKTEYTPTSLAKDISDCLLSSLKSKLKSKGIEDALKGITDPNKRELLQRLLEEAADYEPAKSELTFVANAKCVKGKLQVTLSYSSTITVGKVSITSPASTVGPYGCPSLLDLDSKCGRCEQETK